MHINCTGNYSPPEDVALLQLDYRRTQCGSKSNFSISFGPYLCCSMRIQQNYHQAITLICDNFPFFHLTLIVSL